MVDAHTLLTSLPPNLPSTGLQASLRRNCCYIVSAVIVEGDKIVLIQESKLGCRGKWYLPAGRLERCETLAEGARREVKEEAGLEFTPTRVICIEGTNPGWLRINFAGTATGELKTIEDKESLQARWFSLDEVLEERVNLRAFDIIPVIKQALDQERTGFIGILPVEIGRPNYTVSVAIVCNHDDSSDDISIVVGSNKELPSCEVPERKDWNGKFLLDARAMADMMFEEVLKLESVDGLEYCGITSLCHDGRQVQDGLHFTLLYRATSLYSLPSNYSWQPDTCVAMTTRLGEILSRKRIIPTLDK